MKEGKFRFQKLEFLPLIKIFKKPKLELKRFERLEIDGHKIQVKITEEQKRPTKCPQCQRVNPIGSLYCLYCNHTFGDAAQEVKEAGIENWEVKCGGCGRANNRTQEFCLYCGWRISPFKKVGDQAEPGVTIRHGDEDLLRYGEIITLTIDGKVYHSSDKAMPPDIRELMLKIKKEGYSKEMVDAWVKARNLDAELKRQEIDERIGQLNQRVIWRAVGLAALVLSIIIYFWSRIGR